MAFPITISKTLSITIVDAVAVAVVIAIALTITITITITITVSTTIAVAINILLRLLYHFDYSTICAVTKTVIDTNMVTDTVTLVPARSRLLILLLCC